MTEAGNQAVQDGVHTPCNFIVLGPEERKSLRTIRYIAFYAQVICSIGAAYATYVFARVWFDTAMHCLDTYFSAAREVSETKTSFSFAWTSLWNRDNLTGLFAELDISSVSAAILTGFFAVWLVGGLRNTIVLWRRDETRDGRSYFDCYFETYALFPDYFELLAVRLGLLGTLLSFLLAAISKLAPDKAPAESSGDIFLLLCASLSSTFVGCFVAYVLVPFLESWNALVVGYWQAGPADEDDVQREFTNRVQSLLGVFGEAEEAFRTLTETATKVDALSQSIATSDEAFEKLKERLTTASESFENAAKAFSETETAITPKLEKIAKLPERFDQPLKQMAETADQVKAAAESSQSAFTQLQQFAEELNPTVTLLGRIISSSLTILEGIRSPLTSLGKSARKQSEAVQKMPDLFDAVRLELEKVGQRVDELVGPSSESPEAALPTLSILNNTLTRIESVALDVQRQLGGLAVHQETVAEQIETLHRTVSRSAEKPDTPRQGLGALLQRIFRGGGPAERSAESPSSEQKETL